MTIKSNDALAEAQRVIEQYDRVSLSDIAGMPTSRIVCVMRALAALRPDAAGGAVRIGRTVTDRDATVITACLEFCVRMNEVMADAGLISAPIGRGEIERILRDLAA